MLPFDALAASGPGASAGPSEIVFLIQVLVLLFAGRFLGEVAQRIGQPAVMGQLIAGLLLGPSVLGAIWPDLKLVRRAGRAAFSVSVTGVAVPFLCGFALGRFLPDSLLPNLSQRIVASLSLGTALSISSVKIVAMIVRELNCMRRNLGQVIVASAIFDDTIGRVIIAITFSLASHGTLDAASPAKAVIGTALFLAVSLTIGRRQRSEASVIFVSS